MSDKEARHLPHSSRQETSGQDLNPSQHPLSSHQGAPRPCPPGFWPLFCPSSMSLRIQPPALRMFLLLTALQILAVAMAQNQGDKIIGGSRCIQNSQPWQAALLAGPHRSFLCGGSLLSDEWVITAAHCAHPNLRVALGKHNLRIWEVTQQVLRVVRQVPHPQYNPWTIENDLMLLQLEQPARLRRAVRPIAVASSCASAGTSCLVSGWGTISSPNARFPKFLQCVNINISSDQDCQWAYPGAITAGMICAGVPQGGKNSCQGDSGGPLVCRGELQGLVSWGMENCAQPGYPSVYTNLCKYQTWIQETIQSRS